MTNPTTVPTPKELTVQSRGEDVKNSFTRGDHLGQTGEGRVLEDLWDFFSQKRKRIQVEVHTGSSLQVTPSGSVCSGKKWIRDSQKQAGIRIRRASQPSRSLDFILKVWRGASG